MTINNTPLPPVADPTALQLAMHILASLSDPDAAKARLEALAEGQDKYLRAKAEHDNARAEAEQAVATLASLEADKAALAEKQAEHERSALALSVAADANAQRAKLLDEKERSIEAQASDLQRRTQAFDARVKQFREQLAG
jgi:DNA repair exonuclease SbcCD ATPase subunit